jgi:hypothetical protein
MDAYATATTTGGTAIEETDRLIASDKVEGTAVYNRQGERLGTVDNHGRQVHRASCLRRHVFRRFPLGMGESYHPLPWRVLSYDTRQGGFVIDLDRRRLEKAPSYMASNVPNWSDRTYGNRTDEFYGVPSYWTMI